jgi:hypothetical protein
MNTQQPDDIITQLKQAAESISRRGEDVRAGVSRLVSDAAGRLSTAKDGFVELVRAVSEGAVAGATQVLPEKTESVLRSVVDGLADGLGKSAHAIQLTLQESGARGMHFAKDDLNKIAHDFRSVGESFTKIVGDAMHRLGGHASDQVRSLVEHAKQTLQAARPSLEAAVAEALKNPVQLGRESVQAGASAAREAAGVLFSEIGRRLQGGAGKPNP